MYIKKLLQNSKINSISINIFSSAFSISGTLTTGIKLNK